MEHFTRTQRFIGKQRLGGQALILIVLFLLFAGWTTWLITGRVSVYVVSKSARLEVQALPIQIQPPVDGQILSAEVQLGRRVEKGDILLVLDSKTFELRRAELEVAVRAGTTSVDALRAELSTEEEVRRAVAQMTTETSRTARARISLDEKNLAFKQKELEIGERLRAATAISALDALHSAAGAETQRAQVMATSAQAALDTATSQMTLRERDARLAAVRISLAQAEAEIAKWKAQMDTLSYEIERRTVRAPAAGVLADVMPVSIGMTVTSEQRIATLLPNGPVRVVAAFLPEETIGRMHIGQEATLRLDSFPWAQFGTVTATVTQVGQEPREGTVRVEAAITKPNPLIPVEHGLTGVCEVAVERTSPWNLLLRSVARPTSG